MGLGVDIAGAPVRVVCGDIRRSEVPGEYVHGKKHLGVGVEVGRDIGM